jgi:hypothetical protein
MIGMAQLRRDDRAPFRTHYLGERDDLHRLTTKYDPRYLERISNAAF